MSNICNNEFYAYSNNDDNINVIYKFMDEYDGTSHLDGGIDYVECYFESKWDFPEEKMDDLFNSLPDKNDIYMRCLSTEYENEYVAFYVCRDSDGWQLKY